MGAAAATDVTVTITPQGRNIAGVAVGKNFTLATIAFGDGAITYPAGGVPMPAIGTFGYHKIIDRIMLEQPSDGFVYKYDRANRKIRIWTQGFLTGHTAAGATENGALVKNSVGVEAAGPRMSKTAIDTVYDMGPLIELPTGTALAARTLDATIIGE
jgi:hypothetical protein